MVEPHDLLKPGEIRSGVDLRMVFYRPVVETQEEPLELRDDAVLVVAGIANEGAARVRVVTRQVLRVGIVATPNDIAEQERVAISPVIGSSLATPRTPSVPKSLLIRCFIPVLPRS